ncbi:MAG: hypothetical protein ACI8QC_000374 [Planctomycetota bacterium]|jgi:hypothetical protein
MQIAITLALLLGVISGPQPHADGQELQPPVRLRADTGLINSGVYNGHSGPLFTDITGDGKADLLVGNYKGHIQVYVNVAKDGDPRFEAKGLLEAEGEQITVDNW